MLFILRKLRRSFFLPGKLRTYLAYAVGEILLIVIGILIAVQIGEWREARADARDRHELISQLKNDFSTTKDRLAEALEEAEEKLADADRFLRYAVGENSDLTVSEAKGLIASFWRGWRVQPALGSLESARSTGRIALIDDPAISELIVDFEGEMAIEDNLTEIARQDAFLGSRFEIRKMLGSNRGVLRPTTRFSPAYFAISDEEFKSFIRSEEVYASFENWHGIISSRCLNLQRWKDVTDQLLNRLEELDKS